MKYYASMHKNALLALAQITENDITCALFHHSYVWLIEWPSQISPSQLGDFGILGLVFGRFTNESFSISEGHIGGRDTVPSIIRNDFLNDHNRGSLGRDKKKGWKHTQLESVKKKKRGKKKQGEES